MKKLVKKHKSFWSQRAFRFSVFVGLLLFLGSLGINYIANNYAIEVSSNSVSDVLLDNLPVVDTEIIFVEGSLAFVAFVFLLLIREPQRIPFVLKAMALFVIVRSIFVTLTHLGPFPQHITLHSPSEIYRILIYSSGADLFFSGHTGLPFLFALMFWRKYILRVLFLVSSLVAASSVILGHLHYSIDVMAAFFITFSIFSMAKRFFKTDYRVFQHGMETEED